MIHFNCLLCTHEHGPDRSLVNGTRRFSAELQRAGEAAVGAAQLVDQGAVVASPSSALPTPGDHPVQQTQGSGEEVVATTTVGDKARSDYSQATPRTQTLG